MRRPARVAACAAALAVILAPSARTALPAGPPPLRTARFSGAIQGGETFERRFADSLRLVVSGDAVPFPEGWSVRVVGSDSSADFAAMATPPFHGPHPLDIEAWHFRNADNTGPNRGEVNVPQERRGFSFFLSRSDYETARRALDTLLWPGSRSESAQDSASAVYELVPRGEGLLVIRGMQLDSLGTGRRPVFRSLRFDVELRWPAVSRAGPSR